MPYTSTSASTTEPSVYRTTDGKRTANHLGTSLVVFEGPKIIAELTVPADVTPGEIWQLIAAAPAPAATVTRIAVDKVPSFFELPCVGCYSAGLDTPAARTVSAPVGVGLASCLAHLAQSMQIVTEMSTDFFLDPSDRFTSAA